MKRALKRGLLIGLVGGPITVIVILFVWCFYVPSDDAVRQIYTDHKVELETLKTMYYEDSIFARIAHDFVHPNPGVRPFSTDHRKIGFPDERMQKYRSLFDQIGLAGGVAGDDDYMYFIVKAWGGFSHTGYKGIAWLREPEKYMESSKAQFTRIEGNWYIYYLDY